MMALHWLWLRWRASRLRTLALARFAEGREMQRRANDCDARAEKITQRRESSDV